MGDALIDNGWETDRHWGLKECQIVSAPFSSGVTWLVNVLLELNIRTTNTSFLNGHWVNDGRGAEIGPKACAHLKWHLPVLHERTKFSFEPAWKCYGSTGWISPFIRNGHDSVCARPAGRHLLSLQGNYAQGLSFIDYLRRPDQWRDHFRVYLASLPQKPGPIFISTGWPCRRS